jgi:hypothetical protein
VNKLFLVAGHCKPELFSAETSSEAPLPLLLLAHLLLELISLLPKEFTLLLEKLFKVLLGFLTVEWLPPSGVPRLPIPRLIVLLLLLR